MKDDELPPFITKHGHRLVLAITSLLILYWFWPEIRWSSIFYNDAVSHSAIIRGMDTAWSRGGNITDFWMGYINFGHAILRSYQFLFHVVIWAMHKTLLSMVSLPVCFNICITAMAMALPWCVYKGCRIMGLRRLEAVVAAVALIFLHERDGYGIGLTNFTYSGYGTYNQLFAMLFFPFTVGYAHRMLRSGKHWLATSLFFSATFMAHILTGYFACMWVAIDLIFVLASQRNMAAVKRVATALGKFAGLTLLWTGHWVIPMAQDGLYQHKSEFEAQWKWTGHGAEKMLADFANGQNLDADRFPILTILSALGVLYCLAAWIPRRKRGHSVPAGPHTLLKRYLSLQAVLWLLLTFGPMTWGPVLKLLPFADSLHWHRVIGGTQFAFMLCIGVLLAELLSRLGHSPHMDFGSNSRQVQIAMATSACTLLLVPCLVERNYFFQNTNKYWLKDTYVAWEEQGNTYKPILDFALAHDDARYDAGDPWTWGAQLKVSGTIPLYGLLTQYNVETVGPIHHHQSHTEVLAYKADVKLSADAELMNVRYVALLKNVVPPSGYKTILSAKDGTFYDNGNKSGYFAVGRDIGVEGGCADSEGLSRSVVFFLRTHLVNDHVYPIIKIAKSCGENGTLEQTLTKLDAMKFSAALPGIVLSSEKTPGTNSDIHTAKVHMAAPGILLFKMNFHPGWQAIVNGNKVATTMVVPAFTAIHLPAGDFDIRFSYEVAPLKRVLLYAMIAGLLGLLGLTGFRGVTRMKLRA